MQLQVGVKVLIKNDEDQYLFIKRSALLAAGKEHSWDIPGGRIDPDESLDDALRREVSEEVNHSIQGSPKLIAAQDIFIPTKTLHVVRLTYLLAENITEIKLSEEHQDYTWRGLDKLDDLHIEPYLQTVINELRT